MCGWPEALGKLCVTHRNPCLIRIVFVRTKNAIHIVSGRQLCVSCVNPCLIRTVLCRLIDWAEIRFVYRRRPSLHPCVTRSRSNRMCKALLSAEHWSHCDITWPLGAICRTNSVVLGNLYYFVISFSSDGMCKTHSVVLSDSFRGDIWILLDEIIWLEKTSTCDEADWCFCAISAPSNGTRVLSRGRSNTKNVDIPSPLMSPIVITSQIDHNARKRGSRVQSARSSSTETASPVFRRNMFHVHYVSDLSVCNTQPEWQIEEIPKIWQLGKCQRYVFRLNCFKQAKAGCSTTERKADIGRESCNRSCGHQRTNLGIFDKMWSWILRFFKNRSWYAETNLCVLKQIISTDSQLRSET